MGAHQHQPRIVLGKATGPRAFPLRARGRCQLACSRIPRLAKSYQNILQIAYAMAYNHR